MPPRKKKRKEKKRKERGSIFQQLCQNDMSSQLKMTITSYLGRSLRAKWHRLNFYK